jgi:uncharacterized protein (TIGR03437 family)
MVLGGEIVPNHAYVHRAGLWSGFLRYYLLLVLLASSVSAQLTLSGTLPDPEEDVPYSAQVTVSGGTAPYHFSMLLGYTLPFGLTLSDSGLISGTPKTYGPFGFYIQATDSSSPTKTGSRQYSFTVKSKPLPPFIFVTTTLPVAKQGSYYTSQIQVSGGRLPYKYFVVSAIPFLMDVGLDNLTGELKGNVRTGPGTYPFTVEVWDGSYPQQIIRQIFTITVTPGISVYSSALRGGTVGQAYSDKILHSNGTAPYRYALTSGSLPPGIQLNGNTGALAGTPTVMGDYAFRVTVTDAAGLTGYGDCTIAIAAPNIRIQPGTLPEGRVGTPYPTTTFTASGGVAPYKFTPYVSPPPDGLTLSEAGVLSGTPTRGSSSLSGLNIKVTDAMGNYVTFSLEFLIRPALDITPATLFDGELNVPYSQYLIATGFHDDVTLSIVSGSLPPGIWMSKVNNWTRSFDGTPSKAGAYRFTVRASDSAGWIFSRPYTINIPDPQQAPLVVEPSSLPSARVGESYSQTISAGNGVMPYTFTVASGLLPPGLTLTSSGWLTGNFTTAGTFSFRVNVSDSSNRTASKDYTILVFSGPLAVSPDSIPDAEVGKDFSFTFAASGGTPPYTFMSMIGTPQGMMVSTAGVLSGKPMAGGSYNMRIRATDSLGNTGSRDYTFKISGSIIVIQPETLPAAKWGEPYSARVTATGGTAPYVFKSYGCFPMGLTLYQDGLIAGTPTGLGSNPCVVYATDSTGGYGERRYSVEYIAPPFSVSPLTLKDGTVNVFYWDTILVQQDVMPVQFSVSNGMLPPGLAVEVVSGFSWNLKGVPTTPGTYPFRLTVTSASKGSVSVDYTVKIAPQAILIGPETLPNGIWFAPYSIDFTASGGTPPYIFAVSSGSIPAGLALSAAGALRGTADQMGSVMFTVTATDSKGATGTKACVIVVGEGTLKLSPVDIPTGVIHKLYSMTFSATGGKTPYTFSVATGTLPRGLSLATGGTLSGTPEQSGTFQVRIMVRDSAGAAGLRDYQVRITGDTITIGQSTLPDAYLGKPYSAQLTASGGTPPYKFELSSGNWNAGLKINADGTITGVPSGTTTGQSSFMVLATDANGSYGFGNCQINILSGTFALLPESLPSAVTGQWYDVELSVAGGVYPYTFKLSSGTLPPDVQFGAQGRLLGTPTQAGTFKFRLEVGDKNGATAGRDYELFVNDGSVRLTPTSLPSGKVGSAYAVTMSVAGGTPPYLFSLASGALPQGLTLSSTGALTGTPQKAGTNSFRVQARDNNGATATADLILEILQVGIQVKPGYLPGVTIGSPYSMAFSAEGGTEPYAFSISSGALPRGLLLSRSGELNGNVQEAGTFRFQIEAVDKNAASGRRDYEIQCSPVVVLPYGLGAATVGKGFSATFSASGGTSPYRYARSAGDLPPGLSLSNGTLAGTPTASGTFRFTIQVQGANNAAGSREYALEVYPTGISLLTDSLAAGAVGGTYLQIIEAAGGTAPYKFSIQSGALPSGLKLASTGTLYGTPMVGGTFSFAVQARDAAGATETRFYTLRISNEAPLTILTTWVPGAQVNSAYSVLLQASGGTPGYIWQITAGALPRGLSLSPQGVVDGKPTESGQFPVTVTVSDRSVGQASQMLLFAAASGPDTGNTLFTDPSELSFAVSAGASGDGESKCVAVFATKTAATVSASLFTPPSAWATLSANTLRTPSTICVATSPAGLLPGTYRGELRLTGAEAQPTTLSIPLTLSVEPALPAKLRVTPPQIGLAMVRGAGAAIRSIMLFNDGGGSFSFSVQPPSSKWLSPLVQAGSVSGGKPVAVPLRVDPTGLDPGVYSTDVVIQADESSATVRVEMTVSDGAGLLALSQVAMELVAWAGSSDTTATVGVTNIGVVSLSPEVAVEATDGSGWLLASITPTVLPPGGTTALDMTVRTQDLSPGRYTGWLRVRAAGAVNAPQTIAVGLTVLARGAPLPSEVSLSAIVLTLASKKASIRLAVAPSASLGFFTAVSGAGAGWLKASPSAGTVPADGVLNIAVEAEAAGLAAGLYRGVLSIGFSDGTARSVPVELYVPASASKSSGALRADASCLSATQLSTHALSPLPDFRLSAGRPVAVRARVLNCDGSAASTAEVVARAGSQAMLLLPESPGTWAGTWIPEDTGNLARLDITAAADVSGIRVLSTVAVPGKLGPATSVDPVITAAVHGASLAVGTPVVGGGWLTLYGRNLAAQAVVAETATLPRSLGGIELLLGDLPLPIYYAGRGQVNAIVPRAIPANTQQQLLLRRNGVPAAPYQVVVAGVQPGLFAMNAQGTGQAAAIVSGTSNLAAVGTPAARGGVVELYATGLGAVNDAPEDGSPASLTRLSHAVVPVEASIDGRPARVLFAGLAPGTIGLYQINVEIPSDAPAGDNVTVLVSQGGAKSNQVTIAIR